MTHRGPGITGPAAFQFSISCSSIRCRDGFRRSSWVITPSPTFREHPCQEEPPPPPRASSLREIKTRAASGKCRPASRRPPSVHPPSGNTNTRYRAKWGPALRGMSHPAPSASYGAVDGAFLEPSTAEELALTAAPTPSRWRRRPRRIGSCSRPRTRCNNTNQYPYPAKCSRRF